MGQGRNRQTEDSSHSQNSSEEGIREGESLSLNGLLRKKGEGNLASETLIYSATERDWQSGLLESGALNIWGGIRRSQGLAIPVLGDSVASEPT